MSAVECRWPLETPARRKWRQISQVSNTSFACSRTRGILPANSLGCSGVAGMPGLTLPGACGEISGAASCMERLRDARRCFGMLGSWQLDKEDEEEEEFHFMAVQWP